MRSGLASSAVLCCLAWAASAGDINRQSIVFYEHTPDVFYCPQEKPISFEGMIVKAKPLKKLCEHEGRPLPRDYQSDCWNDVDETEYACSEKERILLKLTPPGSENAVIDNYEPIFREGAYKIREIQVDVPLEEQQAEIRKEAVENMKKMKEEKSREPKHKF